MGYSDGYLAALAVVSLTIAVVGFLWPREKPPGETLNREGK